MSVPVLPHRGKRSVGPTSANCYQCEWKARSNGGEHGRDRVVGAADYHMTTYHHEVGVQTTRVIIYTPDE